MAADGGLRSALNPSYRAFVLLADVFGSALLLASRSLTIGGGEEGEVSVRACDGRRLRRRRPFTGVDLGGIAGDGASVFRGMPTPNGRPRDVRLDVERVQHQNDPLVRQGEFADLLAQPGE